MENEIEKIQIKQKNNNYQIIAQNLNNNKIQKITISENQYKQLCNQILEQVVECNNCGYEVKMITNEEFCPYCFY